MGKTDGTKIMQRQPNGFDDPALGRLAQTLAVWGALGSTSLISKPRRGNRSHTLTEGGLAMNQAAEILVRWGRLGSHVLSFPSEVEWLPAQRMMVAMRDWGEVQKQKYREILDKSEARLAQFGEPLRVDFGAHRWLKGNREESYSDWMAWIVGELRQPDLVFRLFGIKEDAATVKARCEDFLPPDREVWILENTRRLDLVIRYKGAALIVVEVKVTGADSAETAKQEEYFGWMNGQSEPSRHPVLIACDASEEEYSKFRFVSWADVCIELRKIAPRYFSDRPIVAAMILAFVSAVEENLLNLSLPAPEAPAITWVAHSRVFNHIEKSLKGELQ